MVRKTITMPESTVELVRASARVGESFSATVTRLIAEGARLADQAKVPRYVGSGEGPGDLSERAEEYLRQLALER